MARFSIKLVAVLSLLSTPSCLAVTKNRTTYTGKRITDAMLENVKLGSTADQVKSALGEAQTVVRVEPDSETWTYVATRQVKQEASLFLIFHNESTHEYEERVFVSFQDGKAVKVWRQGD